MTDSLEKGARDKEEMTPIDESVIAKLQDEHGALKLTIQLSGLQDHEVADALEIDHGQWSRILSGKSHFPHRKINQLFDVCGNEALLLYLNYSRSYEHQPRVRKSELELRVEQLEREKEILRIENGALAKALGGRAA